MQPHHPTYQGRPLPRPEDELVDQGLAFDVTTALNRRRALRVFGLGAAGVALAACSPAAVSSTGAPADPSATSLAVAEIPDETAGPYPGDGSNGPDVLEQAGIVRQDIRSGFGDASGTAEGVPMNLDLVVVDLARGGVPMAGAAVYVWQCDRAGGYSMYTAGLENQNYLRGVQISDADGRVRFTSVFPGCYPGRWPHVHFEVYPDQAAITDVGNVIATSQLALPKEAASSVYGEAGYERSVPNLARLSLSSDQVFRDDSDGLQLATMTGDVRGGYTASLMIGVDTRTT